MKKYKSFTEFLKEKHGANYRGSDDEMPNAWDDWLSNLEIDDLIDYADEHARLTSVIAMNNAFERFQELQKEGLK